MEFFYNLSSDCLGPYSAFDGKNFMNLRKKLLVFHLKLKIKLLDVKTSRQNRYYNGRSEVTYNISTHSDYRTVSPYMGARFFSGGGSAISEGRG
jgi:hypothetical protein